MIDINSKNNQSRYEIVKHYQASERHVFILFLGYMNKADKEHVKRQISNFYDIDFNIVVPVFQEYGR